MPSTFLGLNISYTGLVASNAGLNTTSNNIANIETKGYSRQQVYQEAAQALRSYTTFGCVGAGVDILGAQRVRDQYYDVKYWNNNSKLGEYDKKQYYAAIVETYLNDTETVKGFTSIFDELEAALSSLQTNTGDVNYALDFVGKAGNLCEYFNLLYNNFQSMQRDVNDEIKIKVDELNSIGQEIASLNKQINIIEMDGYTTANELRDKRDLLVDQLSSIIDVTTEEVPIIDSLSGEPTNANNFMVRIAGGQMLVDGYQYRTLMCDPREEYEKVNQNDILGLFDIKWTDTLEELCVYADTTQGQLKGLIEMRDGNNEEAFNGKITEINESEQTVKIKVSEDYLKDISKSTLPLTNGTLTVGATDYIYKSWSVEAFRGASGEMEYYYTFQLDKNTARNPIPVSKEEERQIAKVGERVDYQGIPYYLEQMNEWIRDYAATFNGIYGQEGATDYDEIDRTGAIFFTGNDVTTGKQYALDVDFDSTKFSSTEDGYFQITAGNFNVQRSIEENPNTMATHTGETDGITKYNIIEQLFDLNTNPEKMEFRGCKAEEFLVCLMGDAALNAASANSFQAIYTDIGNTIENNRLSISGVDADEEAANMIKFQTSYNLSSKMISVLCEIYDKLILETGV
ncbi:MAG: flagellar hook-associated protein FlgK [Lachnospiraceae bacterium]|nr:flagellar hook-associated protein FlgK [Lachnospiraceae bacterium]